MIVTEYNPNHYETAREWWTGNGWGRPIDQRYLTRGLVVSDYDEDYCMGFWYKAEDTPIMWVGWIIGNPGANKEKRSEALDYLINELIKRSEGCDVIFTTSENERMTNRFIKSGFVVGDEIATHLIYAKS